MDVKTKVQKDLDNGMFNRICSNETTFKNYVFNLLNKQKEERHKHFNKLFQEHINNS